MTDKEWIERLEQEIVSLKERVERLEQGTAIAAALGPLADWEWPDDDGDCGIDVPVSDLP